MLDQNTDRMWYVIGAVLVGAAIILIANSTIPEIFASVTESFGNVSNESISSIGELGTISNIQKDDTFKWVIGSLYGNLEISNGGHNYPSERTIRSDYLFLEEGTYEYVSNIKEGSDINGMYKWISFYDSKGPGSTHHSVESWTNNKRVVFVVPEGGHYARFLARAYENNAKGHGTSDFLLNEELLSAVGSEITIELNRIM